MSSLEVTVTAGNTGPVIVLAGEADYAGITELNMALEGELATGAATLTVDASALRFADCQSVRALVLAARSLRDRGGRLVLLRPQPAVVRMLELMGADQVLSVHGSPDRNDL